jgi:hypothetical protein
MLFITLVVSIGLLGNDEVKQGTIIIVLVHGGLGYSCAKQVAS